MRRFRGFLILAALIMMISCKGNAQQVQGIEALKQKIHASDDFKAYVSATKEIMRLGMTDEISFNGVDRDGLSKALKNIKSKEEAIAAYKAAGVKGYEKIGSLIYDQHMAVINIAKNNPELKKLDRQELLSIFKLNNQTDPDSIVPPLY